VYLGPRGIKLDLDVVVSEVVQCRRKELKARQNASRKVKCLAVCLW